MKNSRKDTKVIEEVRQKDAHPDARGFIQNYPDARGFAPGKQSEKPDGKWHSDYPDAHGWHHSSTK
jgi:hypothetical protein